MTRQEPAVIAAHDQWTAVPGTPYEVYQASGTGVAVHLVGEELAFVADGPLRIRLNRAGMCITEFGVRMHPNPNVIKDAPAPTASVTRALGEYQAREWATQMNSLAASPHGGQYWVLLAEPVTRERIIPPGDTGEVCTPWKALGEETAHA